MRSCAGQEGELWLLWGSLQRLCRGLGAVARALTLWSLPSFFLPKWVGGQRQGRPDAVLTEQELWEEVSLMPHHGSWTFLFSCPPGLTYFQSSGQILFAETPTRVNVSVGP